MNAVRIVKRLESDTPHLPELRPFVGKQVEIIVLDQSAEIPDPDEFWRNRTIDELAAAQGITGPQKFEDLLGGWPPEELNDGFEEALERWRTPLKGKGKGKRTR